MHNKVAEFKPELERLEADIAEDYRNRAGDDKPSLKLQDDGEYTDDLYQ
jgi:hypothetical protein